MTQVSVTAELLKKGSRRSVFHCPVSLAFAAAGFGKTWAGITIWSTSLDGYSTRRPLPAVAQAFIHAWDRELPVEPFDFWVDQNYVQLSRS